MTSSYISTKGNICKQYYAIIQLYRAYLYQNNIGIYCKRLLFNIEYIYLYVYRV